MDYFVGVGGGVRSVATSGTRGREITFLVPCMHTRELKSAGNRPHTCTKIEHGIF